MVCPTCNLDIACAKRAVSIPDFWAVNRTRSCGVLFRHAIRCGDLDVLLFLVGVGYARRRQRLMEQVVDGLPLMATVQN